jgi:hypothetical protein
MGSWTASQPPVTFTVFGIVSWCPYPSDEPDGPARSRELADVLSASWYWIIDLAAILLSLSALTGMVTLVSFRARRRSGFIVAALGVVSIVALYLIWVPQ